MSEDLGWMRKPEATVPAIATAPKIDGSISTAEWQGATELALMAEGTDGVDDGLNRRVFIAYDDKNLYIAARLQRPPHAIEPAMPAASGHIDSTDKNADMFEFMLAPNRDFNKAFAFISMANGAYGDARQSGGKDFNWDAPNMRCASRVTMTGWETEMSIPFADLGLSAPPSPEEVWGFDAIDNRRTPATALAHWSYRGGLWKNYFNSGSLRFAKAPAIRMERVGAVTDTQAGALFSIVNETGRASTVEASMTLYKRKPGAQGGPKSFLDNIESGVSQDEQAEFAKNADLNSQVKFALGYYEPVGETLAQTVSIPEGEQRSVGLKNDVGLGEYLLAYQFMSENATLARGTALFRLETPLTIEIEPYWLYAKAVDVVFDLSRLEIPAGSEAHVSIASTSEPETLLSKETVSLEPGAVRVIVPLDVTGIQPGFYRISATVQGPDGVIAENHTDVERPETPEWYQTDAGNKTAVSPGWTPVRATPEGQVAVWNRVYDLSTFLPQSLTSGGKEVLATPVALETVIDGKAQLFTVKSLTLQDSTEGKALYHAELESADATMTGTVSIEFDGFTWYNITLAPRRAGLTLDSVTLRAAIRPDFDALFGRHKFLSDPTFPPPQPEKNSQPGVVQDSLFPFTPIVWIGQEEGGLMFSAESPRDWVVTRPNAVMETKAPTDNQPAEMLIHFVQSPVPFDRAREFAFSLQGTPMRQPSMDYTQLFIVQYSTSIDDEDTIKEIADAGTKVLVFYYSWRGDPKTELGGTPEEPVDPVLKARLKRGVELAHKYGMKVIVYTGWGINAVSPNWQKYGYELGAYPISNKGWGTYLQSAGLEGGYSDYMAWHHAKLADDYGIDGVLYDSLGNIATDTNLRIGNGWVDEEGRIRPAFAVRATRDVYRRIYNVYKTENRPDGFIYNHGGSMWNINIFADVLNRGEGKPMSAPTLREAWQPIEEYRAEYAGESFGLMQSNEQNDHKKLPMSVNNHNAITLHHGTFPKSGRLRTEPSNFSYDQYRRPDLHIWGLWKWLPMDGTQKRFVYFQEQKAVVPENDRLIASAYVSQDGKRAIVVVSNLDTVPVNNERVRLDRSKLGLAPGTIHVEDAILETTVPLQDDTISLDIESERYRLLKVTVSDNTSNAS